MAENLTEALNVTELDSNATSTNATVKFVATQQGMALAYGSLFIMAIVPIIFGALRSVRFHQAQKESGEKADTMSSKDAAMFPIYASCALFSIYLVFKFFSKEYINMLLTGYFFGLGVLALTHISSPFVHKLVPDIFPNEEYHLSFTKGSGDKKEEVVDVQFDRKDLLALAICSAVGVWYLLKKHWIANNLFGFAFSLNAIEMLQLNTVLTGCVLLGGLFVYDIFWVFGTDVMVTVAKSFEAPIKLVFPQDLLEAGLEAKHFAMLGLGDIVIPGIFIALLLRYDHSLQRGTRTYFYSGFIAYCLGLGTTIFVMHFFKHAQPALLYLVPACLGLPTLTALVFGDIKTMFQYADNPEEEASAKQSAESSKEDSKLEDKSSPAANTRGRAKKEN